MGNSQSHSQEEEGHDSNDDTLKQDHFASDPPNVDDLVFSSQINSSINPAFPPPRRPNRLEYSSSPASRLQSSQAPTPTPRPKMSNSSPYQSSLAFNSLIDPSLDLAVHANEYGSSPHLSKKKKRSKKRRSSTSHADEDHRPPIPHSSIDLDAPEDGGDQQQHENPGGDVDEDIDNNSAAAEARIQRKRERKESRRAAKLAKQQAEASSSLEAGQEESLFSDIWLSQERAAATKQEKQDEEDLGIEMVEPQIVELVESQTAVSKKRKRKSHTHAEDEPQHSSKRHKNSDSGTSAIPAGSDGEAHSDAIEEPETSDNGDINFNDLAEQLYSGRKRKSRRDATEEESGPVIETASEHEEPVEDMDVDERIESGLVRNELVESEADDEVERYQDDDIDHDYHNNDDGSDDLALEAPSTRHAITTRSTSTSMENSSQPTHVTRNDELVTGILHDEVVDHEVQNGVGIGEGVVSSHIDSSAYDVEVPSSMPHPSSAGEDSTKRRSANKTNSGRKRVPKTDYFRRMVDQIEKDTGNQSPSTAALTRRNEKGKGKQIAALEDEAQAGPSTANGRARKHKITNMLKDSPDAEAATPSSESVVRLRTPKTPVTLSGAFHESEIQSLNQAIEQFREDHGMTQRQVNDLVHSNPKESRAGELWERIMATTPGRSRQKVINQTRRRFHNFVARGTWTPEQENELRQMYEQYGNKYAQIGQFINRHPEDVRDRIRNYIICGDKLRKDQWSQEESDKLVAIVEQAIAEIRSQRAKRGLNDDRPVEEDINWQLVSQGMGRTRSRLQCISKWKAIKPQLTGGGLDGETAPTEEIIHQARETATTMSYRNRSLVIKEILKTGANADSRIPWLKIRNELEGRWTRPPLMVVWFRLRRTVPNWQSLNVKEICTLLLQNFNNTHKLEYPDEAGNELDLKAEYREIEYKIKKGRKNNPNIKSAAFISKTSDDEDENDEEGETEIAIREQLDATNDEAAEAEAEAEVPRGKRHDSVDLGASDKDREVQDSEPEAQARSHRRRRRARSESHVKRRDIRQDESDDQSSDTNASQVSSIPAR
ncbi:hypothetical protein GGR58DRAFT_256018 [Xylaria digitata]|nr:hypothetical protein GGR58DRAFT_256018 [Xylaria digitata]